MPSHLKHKKSQGKRTQEVRIIGGLWRGRKLVVPNLPGLRPTGNRIRETLFNWLTTEIGGSHCLDLFAGTGALGFESLSRGADSVYMLENHPIAAQQLDNHRQHLQANSLDIIQSDAIDWLLKCPLPNHSIDIVFIDPPFAEQLWEKTFQALITSQVLNENAWIYIESPIGRGISFPQQWELHRSKEAGEVCYQLYRQLTK
jgi:16S rRNA (guanine966-N2)-methyltransferase